MEKARRTVMPEEKFLSLRSANSSSSAKAKISCSRAPISLRERPSIAPLRKTLSRALSSGRKPTPISMKGDRRPVTSTRPESAP